MKKIKKLGLSVFVGGMIAGTTLAPVTSVFANEASTVEETITSSTDVDNVVENSSASESNINFKKIGDFNINVKSWEYKLHGFTNEFFCTTDEEDNYYVVSGRNSTEVYPYKTIILVNGTEYDTRSDKILSFEEARKTGILGDDYTSYNVWKFTKEDFQNVAIDNTINIEQRYSRYNIPSKYENSIGVREISKEYCFFTKTTSLTVQNDGSYVLDNLGFWYVPINDIYYKDGVLPKFKVYFEYSDGTKKEITDKFSVEKINQSDSHKTIKINLTGNIKLSEKETFDIKNVYYEISDTDSISVPSDNPSVEVKPFTNKNYPEIQSDNVYYEFDDEGNLYIYSESEITDSISNVDYIINDKYNVINNLGRELNYGDSFTPAVSLNNPNILVIKKDAVRNLTENGKITITPQYSINIKNNCKLDIKQQNSASSYLDPFRSSYNMTSDNDIVPISFYNFSVMPEDLDYINSTPQCVATVKYKDGSTSKFVLDITEKRIINEEIIFSAIYNPTESEKKKLHAYQVEEISYEINFKEDNKTTGKFSNIGDMKKLYNAGFNIVDNLDSKTYYNIETAARTNGVVDIAAGSQQNNANIKLWSNNGSAAQKFYFEKQSNGAYQIKTDVTDGTSLIEANAGKVANGTNIKQYSDVNQKGSYFIVLKNSDDKYIFVVADKEGKPALTSNNKVQLISLDGNDTKNGTNICTWEFSNANKQKWNLIDAKGSSNNARSKGLTLVKNFKKGEYNIVTAQNSNLTLDVSGASSKNGANISIYDRNFSKAQKFYIEKANDNGEYYIRTLANNKSSSLDVKGASANRGTNVHQWKNNNSYSQKWKIYKKSNGIYVFVNSINGKALDLQGGGTPHKGQNLQVWDLKANSAQSFRIDSATTFDAVHADDLERITDLSKINISQNTWYQIKSAKNTNFQLDVSGNKNVNKANLHIWKGNNSKAQNFKFVPTGDGSFTICTRTSNGSKVLDIAGGKSSAGANVQQYTGNGSNAQKWNIYRVKSTGNIVIKHASGTCVLDISGGKMSNDANVQTWSYNGSLAQQWKVYTSTNNKQVDTIWLH